MIVSIDPGASGGIAWSHCSITETRPMPTTEGDIVELLRGLIETNSPGNKPTFYMEDIVKHMGAGIPASTMAVYAGNWGFIKGCIQYAACRLVLVKPPQWQKFLGLGITGRQTAPKDATAEGRQAVRLANSRLKTEWKNKLKGEAQRLNPHLTVTLKTADALLLLEYGLRQP